MLPNEEQDRGIQAVHAVLRGDFFHGRANVRVTEDGEPLYRYWDIGAEVHYRAGYRQIEVQLTWEDDIDQAENYSARGLHGVYNTNFNKMRAVGGALVIRDGNYTVEVDFKEQA